MIKIVNKRKRKPSYKTKDIDGYLVWSMIPDIEKVKKSDIGKKVWVAGEFKTKKRILRGVYSKGEKSWLNGGVEILELDTGKLRQYYKRKVRLHPDNFKRRYKRRK